MTQQSYILRLVGFGSAKAQTNGGDAGIQELGDVGKFQPE
jgi:hypothetical protein